MTGTIEITNRGYRAAEFRAASLDVEARTVQVVWSTGATVKRWSWNEGEYLEALDMSVSAVDLGRLNAGASFCDNHRQASMENRLGAVLPGSACVTGGEGVATILLSTSRAGEQVLSDLRAGLPLPVSVGYRVSAYEKTEADCEGLATYTATRWEPLELSAVLVPADPGAQARSEPHDAQRSIVPVIPAQQRQGRAGELEKPKMTTTADPAETLERTRADTIIEIAENHAIPLRLARKAVSEGKSVAEFREMALDHKRKEQDKNAIFSIAPYDRGEPDMPASERLADAIACRLDSSRKPEDPTLDFHGLTLPEMARRLLSAGGANTRGLSSGEVVNRALHSTSDFPQALANIANRRIRDEFAQAESALKHVARKTTARDFKPKSSLSVALAGDLQMVNEHGEFKRTMMKETAEIFALATYGEIFGLTRQAIQNDDLGVFDRAPTLLAGAAAATEAKLLADMLVGTRKMSDGKALFHTDHGNLAATGGALSIATLNGGRLAMRKQRDHAGNLTPIEPKFLVVPSELEGAAEQILATINASKIEDVNIWSDRLELIVEPRLADPLAWYLLGPTNKNGFEYGYLEGEEGPQTDQRIGWDIDGVEWKVRLDFGAGWSDTRGAYKNPGATL